MQSTTLYYREGSSDKIYRADLVSQNGGWVVRFAYGRRGSTLTTGTKTNQPLGLEEAQAIFDKLIKSKVAKGYTPGSDGTPHTAPDTTAEPTGVNPQLLNPVDDPEPLLANDAYCLQPKHDGRRMLLRKQGSSTAGINRRGLTCGVPLPIIEAAKVFEPNFLLDGEAVGDTLHVFDLLELNGENLRSKPYRERLAELLNLLASVQQRQIRLVETRFGSAAKRELFARLLDQNAEGVVFKRLDAPSTPGRPASGGSQFKHKFVETASAIVTAVHPTRRSVALGLYDGDTLVPAGHVAIPADQLVPRAGSIVEVRYLYAMPGSNALFQPVCLGIRDDLSPEDCALNQLKYKPEVMEVAA
jgi:bifunctional non-homologous end joining protein LigD